MKSSRWTKIKKKDPGEEEHKKEKNKKKTKRWWEKMKMPWRMTKTKT